MTNVLKSYFRVKLDKTDRYCKYSLILLVQFIVSVRYFFGEFDNFDMSLFDGV